MPQYAVVKSPDGRVIGCGEVQRITATWIELRRDANETIVVHIPTVGSMHVFNAPTPDIIRFMSSGPSLRPLEPEHIPSVDPMVQKVTGGKFDSLQAYIDAGPMSQQPPTGVILDDLPEHIPIPRKKRVRHAETDHNDKQ